MLSTPAQTCYVTSLVKSLPLKVSCKLKTFSFYFPFKAKHPDWRQWEGTLHVEHLLLKQRRTDEAAMSPSELRRHLSLHSAIAVSL